MASGLTYRELRREVAALGKEIRHNSRAHQKTAQIMADEAKDTGRIAEQIASLQVDPATTVETREVARIMQGISDATVTYAAAALEAGKAADAVQQQAVNDHGGIQDAVDSAPVPMAMAVWYTQE